MAVTKKRTTTTVVEEYGGQTRAPKSAFPESSDVDISRVATGDLRPESASEVVSAPENVQPSSIPNESQAASFIAKHWVSILAGAFAVFSAVAAGAWWLSKIDNSVTQVREDSKDLTAKFDRLNSDVIRLGADMQHLKSLSPPPKR